MSGKQIKKSSRGITDREDEIEALLKLVDETEIDLIQMRNLSIAPLLYWSTLGAKGKGIGMKKIRCCFPLEKGYALS